MTDLKNYYLTFGQKSPARNGYILIQAREYNHARAIVKNEYDQEWPNLYEEKDFDKSFFPAGCLRVIACLSDELARKFGYNDD